MLQMSERTQLKLPILRLTESSIILIVAKDSWMLQVSDSSANHVQGQCRVRRHPGWLEDPMHTLSQNATLAATMIGLDNDMPVTAAC